MHKRRILVLKGICGGIPSATLQSALNLTMKLIRERYITTICWSGEGLPVRADVNSFTLLLPRLKKTFPNLEFLFFQSSAHALRSLISPRLKSLGNDSIGPFHFLESNNTSLFVAKAKIPELVVGTNVGVMLGMPAANKLMLTGLSWLKSNLGVNEMSFVAVGVSEATKEELRIILSDYATFGPPNSKFPDWENAHIFSVSH
jgi:hypothetical protein